MHQQNGFKWSKFKNEAKTLSNFFKPKTLVLRAKKSLKVLENLVPPRKTWLLENFYKRNLINLVMGFLNLKATMFLSTKNVFYKTFIKLKKKKYFLLDQIFFGYE